jgi:uncharacterized phage protein (TIGR02220 family)
MARARNIKPAFFTNDDLGEIEPIGRLLFIGLWTIADHNGNIEWRPKKIKAQLFPYDECNIEKLAIYLEQYRFIRFYSASESTYLNIVNFSTHQNPHKNEKAKGTKIPPIDKEGSQVVDLKGLMINPDKSRLKREYSTSDRADSFNLIPDSLILNPESLNPESLNPDSKNKNVANAPDSQKTSIVEIFDYWVDVMNKNKTTKLTAKRKSVVSARLKDGYKVSEIKSAIDGCAKSAFHMGDNNNGTVYDDLTLICRSGDKLEHFSGCVGKYEGQRTGSGLFSSGANTEACADDQEMMDWVNNSKLIEGDSNE